MSWAASETLRDGYQVNLTTGSRSRLLRELQLTAGLTDTEAARKLLVSPHTYRRWRTDREPNPTAVRLLAVQAGYVPWAGWHGWEIHNGLLFPPTARHGLEPGEVESVRFLVALTRDQRRTSQAPMEPAQQPVLPWWRRIAGGWR